MTPVHFPLPYRIPHRNNIIFKASTNYDIVRRNRYIGLVLINQCHWYESLIYALYVDFHLFQRTGQYMKLIYVYNITFMFINIFLLDTKNGTKPKSGLGAKEG